LGVLWLACQVEGSDRRLTKVVESDRWVRTVDGWEKTSQWKWLARYEPALHPLVVASMQLLLTSIAFVAVCPGNPTNSTAKPVVRAGSDRHRRPAQAALGTGT
jgi:hypothetical protein